MKEFTRIEPTTQQTFGLKYKRIGVIKTYQANDGQIHEFTTFYAEGARSGAVLALTSDNQVITTYQFRAGPERWMYDLPGGGFHDGEDAELAALRELAEETGYVSNKVEFLGTTHGDAYTNLERFYYLATDCVPGEADLDKEEVEQGAEVRFISIAELIEYSKTDQMTDPAAVLMAYDKLKAMEGV
ncbi:MAG: NUDIX hydrolase [Candidatus Saccharimonadales bacterium]